MQTRQHAVAVHVYAESVKTGHSQRETTFQTKRNSAFDIFMAL